MKLTDPVGTLSAPIGNTQALAGSLLLLGSVFISACSLGFEHIGGYEPCRLCYIQRHIHYGMVPLNLLLVAGIWRSLPALAIRLAFLALAALLGYGAAVGVYQAGAEWDFWLGPNCVPSKQITSDASNLLSQLQTTKLVSCTVAKLRILGLSFGGWNVVLSSGLIGIALIGALLTKDALAPLFARLPFLGHWAGALQRST